MNVIYTYLLMSEHVYRTCPALCVLMSLALGRGTARCVCLSACPHSSPPGPRIDQLAWPNRRRGAWPGKVNMEKKRHILLPSWETSGRGREGAKEKRVGRDGDQDRKQCASTTVLAKKKIGKRRLRRLSEKQLDNRKTSKAMKKIIM